MKTKRLIDQASGEACAQSIARAVLKALGGSPTDAAARSRELMMASTAPRVPAWRVYLRRPAAARATEPAPEPVTDSLTPAEAECKAFRNDLANISEICWRVVTLCDTTQPIIPFPSPGSRESVCEILGKISADIANLVADPGIRSSTRDVLEPLRESIVALKEGVLTIPVGESK